MIQRDPQGSGGVYKCPEGSLSTGRVKRQPEGSTKVLRVHKCSEKSLSTGRVQKVPGESISVLRNSYKREGSHSIQRATTRIQRDPQGPWGVNKCLDGSLSTGGVPKDPEGSISILRGPQVSCGSQTIYMGLKGSWVLHKCPEGYLIQLEGSNRISMGPKGSWVIHKCPEKTMPPGRVPGDPMGS